MARLKLYIEYDGTKYSGWQVQPNSKTIQGRLLEIAKNIFNGQRIDIQGSGRTDSGVHALCQIAHLDVVTNLHPAIIKMKFNDALPADITIIKTELVNSKFHARHDAKSRSYIYQISRRKTAFGKPFVWWIKDDLNFATMKKAAALFVGMHDYASFTDRDPLEKSTKVLIEDVQFKEEGDLILIRIIGSHFLWKMVRRMVGVLVEIGRKNLTEKDIEYFLEKHSPTPAKYTAPPSGLFLERVIYEGEKHKTEFSSNIIIESKQK